MDVIDEFTNFAIQHGFKEAEFFTTYKNSDIYVLTLGKNFWGKVGLHLAEKINGVIQFVPLSRMNDILDSLPDEE